MVECLGVRFENNPKIHYVEAPQAVPEIGNYCIVSMRRGLELGLVRTKLAEHAKPTGHFVREALEEDLTEHERLKQKAEDLKWLLRGRVKQARLKVKIVHLEFNLDETSLVVNYSANEMLNLRPFVRDLLEYTSARIEFHNVGPRDQARIIGTLGACGTGSCSSTWLQGFNTVGIRMARDQQLPLNPEKISGPCGRLMCCLQFEHEMYQELLKDLPKRNAKACHSGNEQCGRIVKLNPLQQSVDLQTENGIIEVAKEDLVFPIRQRN